MNQNNKIPLGLSFDDIALVPADFSRVISRSDVDLSEVIGNTKLTIPIISSNMTSVFSPALAKEVIRYGGQSIIHRFCSIEENVRLYKQSELNPWISIGSSKEELLRAEELVLAGATTLVLDLAMGNSINAVNQYRALKNKFPNIDIVVSDFCTKAQLDAFVYHAGSTPAAFTLGQGGGSACETRLRTGIGNPSVSAILECNADKNYNLILNGGIRDTGDACKAIALGCKAVIVGRLFASCEESGAPIRYETKWEDADIDGEMLALPVQTAVAKIYKGSASASSYKDQGKEASYRVEEGAQYEIPISGTVKDLMNRFNGGLRSSLSYLDSFNLIEYRENANIIQVTTHGSKEAKAYGKYE